VEDGNNQGTFINTRMEKQSVTVANDLKTIIYKLLSGVVHRVDVAIFKIVIDYIIRNFDPTGINIGGLVDSFYYVFIKPVLKRIVYL
jgi:hypothetical protein